MKFYLFGFLLFVSVFLLAKPILAHQPNYIDIATSQIEVVEPEVSKAYYGALNGQSAVYTINSPVAFKLYVGLLSPDIPGAVKDFNAKITTATGVELASLDGITFSWYNWQEEFAGDDYWWGPEWRQDLDPGEYKITVSNAQNQGKYVLAVGELESFPPSKTLGMIGQIYQMKTKFFEKSFFSIYEGKIGKGLLAVTIIILGGLGWFIRRLSKPKSNI